MNLTKNRTFLTIGDSILNTYLWLFVGNSIFLYRTDYPNIILLIKYIANIAKNNILPTNSGELNELLVYAMLLGLQSAVLIYVLYRLAKKAFNNARYKFQSGTLGIILGMIIFLFLPTTNIYMAFGLVIISIFFDKKLHDLDKEKRDMIIEMIDKVIEEKLLEEQNKQESQEQVQNEEVQDKQEQNQN